MAKPRRENEVVSPPCGPLAGFRIVEFAGIGPAPFAGMVLADLGADVIRVDRPGAESVTGVPLAADPMLRGRRSIVLDLKAKDSLDVAGRLLERADAVIEGFRPGVLERLGLGPEQVWPRNRRLVFGRVTGWGQDGPLASEVGHDINYISLTGALAAIGDSEPVVPLNLVGDFGGGGMLLVVGVLAALHEARASGEGQVVDAAMVDGASLLMTMMFAMRSSGVWSTSRRSNLLDGGAPFYSVYRCRDGRFVAVGAIEDRYWCDLIEGLDIAGEIPDERLDPLNWPGIRDVMARAFSTRARDEWVAEFEGSDACVSPVLDMDEVARHPHLRTRATLQDVGGLVQPAAAPRFSRTPGRAGTTTEPGANTAEILIELGYSTSDAETIAGRYLSTH